MGISTKDRLAWRRALVLIVAFAIAMGVAAMPRVSAYAEDLAAGSSSGLTTQDAATIDSVRTAILALSADPSSYTADDKERVEAIKADFDSLSDADQATLDAETGHSGTGQPLGRVLETALWGVWSYNPVDNSTTLADRTYDATTTPALSSEYSKGKSTSGRQKPWSVKSVEVRDGKAYATIMVESETYTDIWMGGKTYPKTNESGYCEFANVPIDLNSTFYFAGVSSSMSIPIAFSLTTTIDESTPADPTEPVVIPEENITNNTGMFKVVTATAVPNADGSAVLTFALSGSGYHWLYKGTYEEALAANEAIAAGIAAETGSDKLVKGYTNDDGKWEFQMTVAFNELGNDVPVVAISDSYYKKYVNGQNPLERAYYPRQFNLNLSEATLVTGDFDATLDFELTSEVADFKAASPVSVNIVGGPNSNGYKVSPTLVMQDATYDSVTYPCVVDSAVATATATLAEGKFAISMENEPNKTAFQDKTPLTFTFHVSAAAPYEEAGTNVVRTVTFDQVARTIKVEGEALTPKKLDPGQYIIPGVCWNTKGDKQFTMVEVTHGGDADKALLTVAEDGSATITFDTNTRTTYSGLFFGKLGDQVNEGPNFYAGTKIAAGGYEFTFPVDVDNLTQDIDVVPYKPAGSWYTSNPLVLRFQDAFTPIAVYEVEKQIAALPAAEDVTIAHEAAIVAARGAYDALSVNEQALVSNYSKLVAAEEAFAALAPMSEETEAVIASINDLISAWRDVDEVSSQAIADARTAYEALDKVQKAYVPADTYAKLVRAEACVAFTENTDVKSATIVDPCNPDDEGVLIGATLSPRSNAYYLHLYTTTGEYNKIKRLDSSIPTGSNIQTISGTSSMQRIFTSLDSNPQGREYEIALLDGTVETGKTLTFKVPSVFGAMAKGTYNVVATQVTSSDDRKFANATIASDGTDMIATFTVPSAAYDKVYLGNAKAAAADAEGAIAGDGGTFAIPVQSMYQPIEVSYHLVSDGSWVTDTIEFVVDEQTQAVVDAIAQLNAKNYWDVTIDQREAVEAASALYAQLDDNQKALMDNSNYYVLYRCEVMYVVAAEAEALIVALPEADAVTEADADAIVEAKKTFDNMGESEKMIERTPSGLQNSQIEKLVTEESRAKLNADLLKIAEMVAAKITALPEPAAVTDENKDAVVAAHELFAKLQDSNSKAPWGTKLTNGMTAAEAAIVTQDLVDKVEAAAVVVEIAALPAEVTADDVAAVAAAQAAYDALTDDQKALVPAESASKLEAAEDAMVQVVDAMIKAAAESGNADDVAAARAAFDMLTDEQKAQVDELKLLEAEQAVAQAAAAAAQQAADEAQAYADANPEDAEAQAAAVQAKLAAADAKVAAAEAAQAVADKTAAEAQAAQAAAEQAAAEAQAAQAAAEQAAADAQAAQAQAESDAAAAQAAQAAAEQAAADAAAAQAAAEQKAADAQAAQEKAEGDAAAAQAAQAAAEQAATDAQAAQAAAEQKAADAEQKAADAEQKAADAEQKAADAEQKAADAEQKAASSMKANPMTVTTKVVKAKAKKKTKVAKAKAFVVKDPQGKVTFAKLSGNAKITVKANGKVIVAKGLKKGKTYKVKVMVIAKGDEKTYAPGIQTVTLKVKITK